MDITIDRDTRTRVSATVIVGALIILGAEACIPDFHVASDGGVGSTGDGGSGGNSPCEPESEVACYSGIPGTEGLGLCTPGKQVCDAQGSAYGPCDGSGAPKLEDCSTPEDENCDGKPGCTGECLWTRRFETREVYSSGNVFKLGIGGTAVDHDWNTIVVGGYDAFSFQSPGPPDFGGGPLPCTSSQCGFVAKFDPQGKHLWSKSFDSYAGEAVAVLDNGDIVLVARGGGVGASVCGAGSLSMVTTVVASLDPDGDCKPGWAVELGVKPLNRPSLAVDKEGAVYVTFDVESGKIGDTYYGDQPILARIEPSGGLGWVEEFGGLAASPVALAVDSMGDVYITGDKWDDAEFGPNITLPPSYEDIFVAKFRPSQRQAGNGPWLWARQMNVQPSKGAYAGDIVTKSDGTVFIVGRFTATIQPETYGDDCPPLAPNGADLFVAQLGPGNGYCQHIRALGATGISGDEVGQYFRLRLDPNYEHLLLAGRYEDQDQLFKEAPWKNVPSAPGGNIFVAKLEVAKVGAALEPIWVRGFGGQYQDFAYGLAVDSGGSMRLSGIGRTVDFGCGGSDNIDENFFVTRLSP